MTYRKVRVLLRDIADRHKLEKKEIHESSKHLWLSGVSSGYRIAVRANANGTFYMTLCEIDGRQPAVLEVLPQLGIHVGRKNKYPAVSRIPSEEVLDAILTLFRAEAALDPR